jgi:hypothetical protein
MQTLEQRNPAVQPDPIGSPRVKDLDPLERLLQSPTPLVASLVTLWLQLRWADIIVASVVRIAFAPSYTRSSPSWTSCRECMTRGKEVAYRTALGISGAGRGLF